MSHSLLLSLYPRPSFFHREFCIIAGRFLRKLQIYPINLNSAEYPRKLFSGTIFKRTRTYTARVSQCMLIEASRIIKGTRTCLSEQWLLKYYDYDYYSRLHRTITLSIVSAEMTSVISKKRHERNFGRRIVCRDSVVAESDRGKSDNGNGRTSISTSPFAARQERFKNESRDLSSGPD